MPTWQQKLAQYEATDPAPVADLGNVIASASTATTIGPVLAKLAAGWSGSFAELVVTAASVADPSADDALAFEIVLNRLNTQRGEDRFFHGGAEHRKDWPVRRALDEAQDALGKWREARTGCAGCGRFCDRWPSSTSMGVGPTFFVEHWCGDCATYGVPQVDRLLPKLDFAGLHDRYGKVAVVGSAGSGYTL